ncbi:hypothetical protein [Paenibacillus turpanensis]|uniref:hypothetical protein n=1 Tax=Paenibacillus turpanensis TaxID=2689078 RepID=UPI001407D899|nr:hypothetical protein [Paenibacillus turpanensis]
MFRFLFMLIGVLVAATACSTSDKGEPVQYEKTVGDLSYVIRLSKQQFERNEEIPVYAKVTNLGNETLTYVKGSSSCPVHISVEIINQESMKSLAHKQESDIPAACTADLIKAQLKPNQTIEQEFVFIGKHYGGRILESPTPRIKLDPAPPGIYKVQISLTPEDFIIEDHQRKTINPRPSVNTSIVLY